VPDDDAHYRRTFEFNPHTQWTALPTGELDRVSRRWEEWTGTSGLGGSWQDAMHRDDVERTWNVWKACLASGEEYDIEHRARMRDGGYRWMRSRATPWRDDSGQIIKWYGTTQDVHVTKQLLAELSQREQDFRALAEAGPNHAWMADTQGRIIWCNQRTYDYTGLPGGALDGQAWTRIIHPEDLAQTMDDWGRALLDGSPYESEFRMRRNPDLPGDPWRWFMTRALPVRDARGAITHWIGTSADVHQRKLTMAKLARLNDSLEEEVASRTAERDRIWHLSSEMMLVARFDGAICAINPAWEANLGWREEEIVGHNFLEFIHVDDHSRTLAEMAHQESGRRTLRFENRYRNRDGQWHWLSWTAVPDQSFIYGVARDVTEHKKQAEALAQAENALRQSQKMEAVGQLTGGIAHDFNNLLAGLKGNLEILQFRLRQGQSADLERYIAAANGAADRAAALTQRLLAFSRQQTLAPRLLAINQLVTSMMGLFGRTVGPSISIRTKFEPALWNTLADGHQLENALLNLVINARDAMPEGGEVIISTENLGINDQRRAEHLDVPPADHVLLCVHDTGSGMSREVAERAFDPFFSTKPSGQGTGLGLAMTYGFVSQSGGHVRIHSTPGRGTRICIYLPRHDAPAASSGAAGGVIAAGPCDFARDGRAGNCAADSTAAFACDSADNTADNTAAQADYGAFSGVGASQFPRLAAPLSILLVEDEEPIRNMLMEMLADWGHFPVAAADAAQAMAIVGSDRALDLMISDIGLPGTCDGRQLAERTRLVRPALKVLFITGFIGNPVARRTDLGPGMALLKKPFALDAFAKAVADLVAAPSHA
jgi:PAS domain S-box-containing protein